MAGESKSTLSKNVLQMKFMQRSVLRVEKEQNEEEEKRIIDDEHWVLDLPDTQQKESKYVFEPSYIRIENLRFGRMSFKGFNPEIEKLMKSEDQNLELEEAERKESEIRVDDEEMAQRYESLIGTIHKKFTKKRQREDSFEDGPSTSTQKSAKKAKREFLKPGDD